MHKTFDFMRTREGDADLFSPASVYVVFLAEWIHVPSPLIKSIVEVFYVPLHISLNISRCMYTCTFVCLVVSTSKRISTARNAVLGIGVEQRFSLNLLWIEDVASS